MESKKIESTEIKPLTTPQKSERTIKNSILPDPKNSRPFFCLISARISSGKTVLIANLLKNKEMYYHYFDKVFMCNSNIKDGEIDDESFNGVKFNKKRMFDDIDFEILQNIYDDIKETEDYKEKAFLLICDDLGPNFEKMSSGMLKLFLKHRHYKLSIILVSQAVRLFSRKLRANASHLISFYCSNLEERKALNEITNLNQKLFDDLLDYCCSENYSFMFVDLLTPRKIKVYKNLNEEVIF